MFEIIPLKIDSPLLTSGLSFVRSITDNPAKFAARKIKVKYKIETYSPKNNIFDKFLINNFLSTGRRGDRRRVIFFPILPYQNISFCYDKLVKLIRKTSENLDGAKRTRTADPLHAMKG